MSDKARKIAFTVIASVMSVFTIFSAMMFCGLAAGSLIDANDIGDINIDATDFTPVVQMGAVIMDGLLRAIVSAVLISVTVIVIFAVWGIFLCITLKNAPAVGKDELILTRRVFLISSSAVLVVTLVYAIVCAVQVGRGDPFWALLLCLPNPLFMWVFYIRNLKKLAD